MRWARNVTGMGRGEVYAPFWWGNIRERHNLEDLGVNGSLKLKRILWKSFGGREVH
jgi:hypothetical protein